MFRKNVILLLITIIVVLSGVHAATAQEVATIHGAVYEWGSFDPLENVIVQVNSTPPQSMLAKHGIYSFDLVPGHYVISASYYTEGDMVAYTEEEIYIDDDGDYVYDLLLFPVYYDPVFNESEFSELDEIAFFADNDEDKVLISTPIVIVLVLFLIVVLFGYFYIRHRKAAFVPEEDITAEERHMALSAGAGRLQELPADLRELVDIIASNDGRITQKELRTKVRHSEAKVSLMISDLESRGIVRKYRKGRGNIVILEDTDDPNQNI
ncbi:helix-turn-helix transcriptional regulator [Methanolobus sp. WCC5]|uniref:helix-turn-helix transcriptional regulator n=1 Tax=Methanolobus sp. WCC5 TaxID=3125785 RepID=UPI0032432229